MRLIDRFARFFVYPKIRLRINPYFFSFLIVLVTVLINFLLNPHIESSVAVILYVIPVLLASVYGGFLQGIVASLLSIISMDFFFVKPYLNFTLAQPSIFIRMCIFFVISVCISFFSEMSNRTEKKLQDAIQTEQLAKRNAEQQTRMREHFIAVASHELKSPITAQKANLQLLRDLLAKNRHQNYVIFIDKILLQTDRLTNFVNDLLDISKMNTRKFQYRFSNFDTKEALNDALDQIQNLLISHKIKIKGKIHKSIYGDKERITQVLTNLLSNAIKYSPEETEIIIRLVESKKNVQISVQDFGIGIEDEYKEKIFNRFFRVTGNDESDFKGFGLGLYLTTQIIKKHKGKIWVESEKGKGSTFIFILPLTNNRKQYN